VGRAEEAEEAEGAEGAEGAEEAEEIIPKIKSSVWYKASPKIEIIDFLEFP